MAMAARLVLPFVFIVSPFTTLEISNGTAIYKAIRDGLRYVLVDILADVTTEVNLERNKIKLQPNDFPEFYVLEKLNLGYNQMHNIEVEAFRNMTNLKTLNLQVNEFTNVPDFNHIADTLEKLSLKNNPIEVIYDNTFSHFSALKSLELQNCKISLISTTGLFGLVSLETLSLSNNHLSSLHIDVFKGLVSVTNISLEKNSLKYLPNFNLSTLKTLNVKENKLVGTKNGSFAGAVGLKTLYLSNTELTEWPELDDAKYVDEKLNIKWK